MGGARLRSRSSPLFPILFSSTTEDKSDTLGTTPAPMSTRLNSIAAGVTW
ncbi:hypothetical protein RND71_038142 [Anisodus tanguticus]|uniref:Uncharacterized protein n=1 Tax=Anisodus tanguticus TaxID=243964 RepID=A0AAE1UWQ7_9SOLA|nr:hypothetical protein RND71_038142 [Anisodus tanguticus]